MLVPVKGGDLKRQPTTACASGKGRTPAADGHGIDGLLILGSLSDGHPSIVSARSSPRTALQRSLETLALVLPDTFGRAERRTEEGCSASC